MAQCWDSFKLLKDCAGILETWEALNVTCQDRATISRRRQAFDSEVKRLIKFVCLIFSTRIVTDSILSQGGKIADEGFDIMFVMVGQNVNEDGSLGAVWTTPRLEGVCFPDVCVGFVLYHFQMFDKLSLSNSEIIAAARCQSL